MHRIAFPWEYNTTKVDYFETPLISANDSEEAVKLCNGFLTHPITEEDLDSYLEEDPDGNEIWLLYRMQKILRPVFPFANSASKIQKSLISGLLAPRYLLGPKFERVFEAVICLRAISTPESLSIHCDAFCRDPWADPAVTAYWADLRLRNASEALGGANEIEIIATESDTPLQRELKKLGYFCFAQDPDTGDFFFSKVLTPRSRKHVLGPIRRGKLPRSKGES